MAIDVVIGVRSRRVVDIVVKLEFEDRMSEQVQHFLRKETLTTMIKLLETALQLKGRTFDGDYEEVPMNDGFFVTTKIVFKKHEDLMEFLVKTMK